MGSVLTARKHSSGIVYEGHVKMSRRIYRYYNTSLPADSHHSRKGLSSLDSPTYGFCNYILLRLSLDKAFVDTLHYWNAVTY